MSKRERKTTSYSTKLIHLERDEMQQLCKLISRAAKARKKAWKAVSASKVREKKEILPENEYD